MPEHEKLSSYLRHLWGPPEKLIRGQKEKLTGKSGVISFFRIPTYDLGGQLGGHIDLVTTDKNYAIVCLGVEEGCWNAAEFWFWPALR